MSKSANAWKKRWEKILSCKQFKAIVVILFSGTARLVWILTEGSRSFRGTWAPAKLIVNPRVGRKNCFLIPQTMHWMEARLFCVAFATNRSVTMDFGESAARLILRIFFAENRADSSWSADSLAAHARLCGGWFRLLEIVRLRSDDPAAFNGNRDDKFSRWFLNWLFVIARRDGRRRLHEWLSWRRVWLVRIVCRLARERIPANDCP